MKKGAAERRFVDGGLALAMTNRWWRGCLWVAAHLACGLAEMKVVEAALGCRIWP